MTINRTFFFNYVRANLFTGRLSTAQVDGMNHILDIWEAQHTRKDDRWLAYALGTAFHETACTMQPIPERGGKSWLIRMYSPFSPDPRRAALAKRNGQRSDADALAYCGKGYVQLTWRNNYIKMGTILSVPLEAQPDLALDPNIAAKIMFYGMENGTFTGAALGTYFNATKDDWRNARKIINGLDCAEKIAEYGKAFYAALAYTV
jgi:putative chitinase